MTNNEAIILLRNLEDALDSYCELNEEGKTAFRMAIESLGLFGNSEHLLSAQLKRTGKRTETHSCDYISRQAAIDAVEESRRLNHHQDGKEACAHEYEHRHFLKILMDLPSAQPEQWIPVDEAMPDESGRYLIWDDFGYQISDFDFHEGTFGEMFSGIDWETGEELMPMWVEHEGTLAWCELPLPYKGEQE